MTEAEQRRDRALAAAGGRLVTSRPADVRWLLCGRGRPVDSAAPAAGYTIVLEPEGAALVLYRLPGRPEAAKPTVGGWRWSGVLDALTAKSDDKRPSRLPDESSPIATVDYTYGLRWG